MKKSNVSKTTTVNIECIFLKRIPQVSKLNIEYKYTQLVKSYHVIYHSRDSVSVGYPNTEKRVEKTMRSTVFLTILVFG